MHTTTPTALRWEACKTLAQLIKVRCMLVVHLAALAGHVAPCSPGAASAFQRGTARTRCCVCLSKGHCQNLVLRLPFKGARQYLSYCWHTPCCLACPWLLSVLESSPPQLTSHIRVCSAHITASRVHMIPKPLYQDWMLSISRSGRSKSVSCRVQQLEAGSKPVARVEQS